MSSALDKNNQAQQQQQQPQQPDGKPRDPSGRLWQHSTNNITVKSDSYPKVEADQSTAKTHPESSLDFDNNVQEGRGEADNAGRNVDVGQDHDDDDDDAATRVPPPSNNSYWDYISSYIWLLQYSEGSVISELSSNSGGAEVPDVPIGLEEEEEEEEGDYVNYEDVVLHEVLLQTGGSFDVVLKGPNSSDAEVPSSDVVGERRHRLLANNNMFLLRFQRKKGKISLVEDDDSDHDQFLHNHQQTMIRPLMTASQLRGLIQFAIRLATRYHQISTRCWVVGIMLLILGTAYVVYGILPSSHHYHHFHDDKVFGLNIALGSGIPLALTGMLFVVLGRAHQPSGGTLFADEFNNNNKLFLRYHSKAQTTTRRRPSAATAENVPGIKIHYQSRQDLQRYRDDETVQLVAIGGGDQHHRCDDSGDEIMFGLEVHVVSSSLNLV